MRQALFILILLSIPLVFACPELVVEPLTASVPVGELIEGTVAAPGAVIGASALNAASFNYSNGAFSLTAESDSRVLFYAVDEDGCTVTQLGKYTIIHPPRFENITPEESELTVLEGKAIYFQVKSTDGGSWYHNNNLIAEGDRFLFHPGYTDAGQHRIEFRAEARGLTTEHLWTVQVQNDNRPPVQVTDFIGATIPIGEELTLNMSLYFFDPDQAGLTYAMRAIEPEGLATGGFTYNVVGDELTLTAIHPGKRFLVFSATDPIGASAESEQVAFIVANASSQKPILGYCGDGLCILEESCENCELDCGKCDDAECSPQWDCSDWGECVFPGFQERVCALSNACAITDPKPALYQECEYNPRCDDGVRNGNETGVDCGGSCLACPTCDDGILNQGEEAIDCGGPCTACPSCADNTLNQDETDIDCGGSCPPCPLGARCTLPLECESRMCIEQRCEAPGCYDGIVNQGEQGIDCGGPCDPCPSCDDGVKNQNEQGIDCGGPCATCPTCDDGIKNQGETLVDCNGPCRACMWQDYLPIVLRWLGWVAILFGVIFFLWFAHSIVASRMTFLFSHGKGIHFFYEDGFTYALVRFLNKLAKPFRLHRDKDSKILVDQAMRDLKAMRSLPEPAMHMQLVAKLRELHGTLTNLGAGFTFEALVEHIKIMKTPFSVKVIMLRNTKLLYIVERTKYYPSANMALDEVLGALDELKKAF